MNIKDFALYRDDGICALKGSKKTVEDLSKNIRVIFREVGLKLDIPTGPSKSVDFLDLNLNLTTGFHAPYRKPLNVPLFIHKDSNHPPKIKEEIPKMVCKRLSNNSSNKEIFDNSKQPYIDALKKSGFENITLDYIPKHNQSKPKAKKLYFITFHGT